MSSRDRILGLWWVALSLGCQDVTVANRSPVAAVRVERDGEPIAANRPIAYGGEPVTLTLDASRSSDSDGEIAAYLWLRTDIPGRIRYPEAGPPNEDDAGVMLPMGVGPYDADPERKRKIEVTLPSPGRYKFSLWVWDDDAAISKPATVTLVLMRPMPMAGGAAMP